MNRYKLLLVVLVTVLPLTLWGQVGDPEGIPGEGVPFSGIEILLGLGGLYGAKKVYDNRKRKS